MGVRKKLPDDQILRTSDPRKRYLLMSEDVELLYKAERFTSCTVLLLCFVDALASPGMDSDRGRFGAFVKQHFPDLHAGLEGRVPGKSAGDILYDRYRNGLVHGLGPKSGFALCRDSELEGAYVDEIEVEGVGSFIGLNVDRLVGQFQAYVRKKHEEAA